MRLRKAYYSEALESWCVPLTKGDVALIDEQDVDLVSQYNWYSQTGNNTKYAANKSKASSILLHRLILGDCDTADHINGDGLDNRRTNLRSCSTAENNKNTRKRTSCRSKYKGVVFDDSAINKWKARIYNDGRQIVLGRFSTEEEAAFAYNEAATLHHGKFANLNLL